MAILGFVCDGSLPTRICVFNGSRIEILCGRSLRIGMDVAGNCFGIRMERKHEQNGSGTKKKRNDRKNTRKRFDFV